MASDRSVQECIARAVATMVFYHNSESEPTSDATEWTKSEVQDISQGLRTWGLDPAESGEFLHRVKCELVSRYGHVTGQRLNDDFVRSFNGLDPFSGTMARDRPGDGPLPRNVRMGSL